MQVVVFTHPQQLEYLKALFTAAMQTGVHPDNLALAGDVWESLNHPRELNTDTPKTQASIAEVGPGKLAIDVEPHHG